MGGQKEKKDKKDKKGKSGEKAKLQLKGRIFMTNVTEVLSLAKQGSSSHRATSPPAHHDRFVYDTNLLEGRSRR